jgi:hypothetical protein
MLSRLFLLALVLTPLACRGTETAADIPCTCGEPATDIEGCAHPLCVSGKHNPDNPDCVCGTLSLPKK